MVRVEPVACSTAAEANSLPVVHTIRAELTHRLSKLKGVADSVARLG